MAKVEWWTRRWVVPAAALAALVPLLWPHLPPLADVPGHMASYHVSIAIGRSPALQQFFAFNWQLLGNLGGDLLVVPLSAVFGVEFATKLIVLAIPALTALALLLLARQVHGRLPATALAAVPLVYNAPFMFGFVNYSLACVLALFGLLLWLHWPSDRRSLLRGATFAVLAAAVWTSHAIGWLMLGAMCGAAELRRRLAVGGTAPGQIVGALAGTALTCIGLAAPIILIRLSQHADHGSTFGWFWKREMLWAVIETLRDRWALWDITSVAVIIVLVAAASFRLGGLRLVPLLFWPAAALAALFVVLPMGIDGSLFVNTRIFPYALALGIIAIDTGPLAAPRRAALAAAAALFCLARLAGNTASMFLYDASFTRELGAVDHLPPGAAALTFVEMPCNGHYDWKQHRLEHIAGMATVRRDAFVNALWTIKGLQLLRNQLPQAAPFDTDPSEFVSYPGCGLHPLARQAYRLAPLHAFTHLWLIGVPAALRPRDARLQPVWAAGDSILYRIVGRP